MTSKCLSSDFTQKRITTASVFRVAVMAVANPTKSILLKSVLLTAGVKIFRYVPNSTVACMSATALICALKKARWE